MKIIGTILIILLLVALYAFLGWGIYMLIDENTTIDAEDYFFGIVVFWPFAAILLAVVSVIQLVKLVSDLLKGE